MRLIALAAVVLLSGCAAGGPWVGNKADGSKAEIDRLNAQLTAEIDRLNARLASETERLNAQLAAEVAERHRVTRAASRREEALRRQLDAMKSIERGILEREDRMPIQTR